MIDDKFWIRPFPSRSLVSQLSCFCIAIASYQSSESISWQKVSSSVVVNIAVMRLAHSSLGREKKKNVNPCEDLYLDVVFTYHLLGRGALVSKLKEIGLSLSVRSNVEVGLIEIRLPLCYNRLNYRILESIGGICLRICFVEVLDSWMV